MRTSHLWNSQNAGNCWLRLAAHPWKPGCPTALTRFHVSSLVLLFQMSLFAHINFQHSVYWVFCSPITCTFPTRAFLPYFTQWSRWVLQGYFDHLSTYNQHAVHTRSSRPNNDTAMFRFLTFLLLICYYPSISHCFNPFSGRRFYVNPFYTQNVQRTIQSSFSFSQKLSLRPLLSAPTAIWLVSHKSVNSSDGNTMRGHLLRASKTSPPSLVTFVVYNLPNRDCASGLSLGELCCKPSCNKFQQDGRCDFGLRQYRKFIDIIARISKNFCGRVPMAFIIEPDSIPNLVTNTNDKRCGSSTAAGYREGVKYAVNSVHNACRSSSIYLDGAHGAWLGWDRNRFGFAREVKRLNVASKLRGFALNVANYEELGSFCPRVGFCMEQRNRNHPCCRSNGCNLIQQFNPGHNALNYVMALNEALRREMQGFRPKYIIDTSRNGAPRARQSCSNFCNVRRAGLGVRSTTRTANPALIDAYFWIKPPGESDGCSRVLPGGGKCPRFTHECESKDSVGQGDGGIRAPEAGIWFPYYIRQLIRNGK